jgi:hypothetical protein
MAIELMAIDQHDQPMVVLLPAHLHLHPVQLLADLHRQVAHHLRVHNLATNVQLEAGAMTALVLRAKSHKVVKSVIHAGFVLLRKSVTDLEFVPASLNQIFLKMSLVKS